MPSRLGPDDIQRLGTELPDWRVEGDELVSDFSFDSFVAAMEFMNSMATESELLNHHPTWTNTYNRVSVRLTTHDVDGLSDSDVAWARAADERRRPA